MKKLALALAAAMALSACATDPNTGERIWGRTAGGVAIGAAGGAAAGALLGGNAGRAAAIGAAVGAVAGGAVGAYMDRQEAELRRQTAGTGIGVRREGDQIYLDMPSDVTFASGQSSIQPQFYGTLNDLATTLNQYPETAIDIVGHADSTGAADFNQRLSEQRATSVSSYLSSQGVEPVRVYATGRGENDPIADNSTAAGRAQNRRVEVVLTPIVES